jgi:hypothetical protein
MLSGCAAGRISRKRQRAGLKGICRHPTGDTKLGKNFFGYLLLKKVFTCAILKITGISCREVLCKM